MPDSLQALLDKARSAGPLDRIEYRDRIAAYGTGAVAEMTSWIPDPALGGFAVRVLERVGREPDCRSSVVDALMGARSTAPDAVRDDIDGVLLGLGKRVTRRTVKVTPARARTS